MAQKETPEQKVEARIQYLQSAKLHGLDVLEGESRARQRHASLRLERLQGTHQLRAAMAAESAWTRRLAEAEQLLGATDEQVKLLVGAAKMEAALAGTKDSTESDETVVPDTTTTTTTTINIAD